MNSADHITKIAALRQLQEELTALFARRKPDEPLSAEVIEANANFCGAAKMLMPELLAAVELVEDVARGNSEFEGLEDRARAIVSAIERPMPAGLIRPPRPPKPAKRWIVAVDMLGDGPTVSERVTNEKNEQVEIVSYANRDDAEASIRDARAAGADTEDWIAVEVRIDGNRVYHGKTGIEMPYAWK